MSVFKLTAAGDLDRGPDNLGFSRVNGIDENRVHVATRAKVIKTEVRRNARVGFDLFWALQPDTPSPHIANHIAMLIAGTPGVVDVVAKYSFEGETGIFAIQAEATYDSDDQRERRTEHETFLLRAPALIGAPSRG